MRSTVAWAADTVTKLLIGWMQGYHAKRPPKLDVSGRDFTSECGTAPVEREGRSTHCETEDAHTRSLEEERRKTDVT